MNRYSYILYGHTGQLGSAFLHKFVNNPDSLFVARSRFDGDWQSDELLSLLSLSPTVIINAAAMTDVGCAEREPDLAMVANRDNVAKLAFLAHQKNALLVHFSTDYVFDGSGYHPWCELDQPRPLNSYGQSKWEGEQAIIASGCRYLIIRTSWLHSPWRHNFIKTMLHLGQSCDELSVVYDQVGAPTSAVMLAEVVLLAIERILAEPSLEGLYHVAASGETSWFDYANFIFSEGHRLGLIGKLPKLIPVTGVDYHTPVRRPLNSRFNTTLFCKSFNVLLPDWREGVRDTLWKI